jgi:tartrate dehydratase alpha subunit/fumarate hydratase class I-like protein
LEIKDVKLPKDAEEAKKQAQEVADQAQAQLKSAATNFFSFVEKSIPKDVSDKIKDAASTAASTAAKAVPSAPASKVQILKSTL